MNQFRRYLEVYKMEERGGKWTMRNPLHRPCRLVLVLFNEKYYRRNKERTHRPCDWLLGPFCLVMEDKCIALAISFVCFIGLLAYY